nr:FUSC family protein [Granulicella sp. dw_53]
MLDEVNWKHGVKTALAAGLCLALVRVFAFSQGYWACITAVVVMQSETAATLAVSRERLVGTAVGAIVGWATAAVWHGHLMGYAAAVLACMVLPELMGLKGAGRMAGVAATIVLLVPSSESHATVARGRFLEVSFGIVVALVVSQVLWRNSSVEKVLPKPANE